MKTLLRLSVAFVSAAAIAGLLSGCEEPPSPTTSITLTPAPPGPTNLGPALNLSAPPPGAVVFDLKYRPERGQPNDIPYSSFWGYGGDEEQSRTNSFLKDVRKQAPKVSCEYNHSLPGREWSAVEHTGRKAVALYFDLNADGKLSDNERILPTRSGPRGIDFITPDFMLKPQTGEPMLCRVLLRVEFHSNDAEPNCMWSPACMMEGTGKIDGREARVLLLASEPGGVFNQYGRSCYALYLDGESVPKASTYVPRSTLSSLIKSGEIFYHLKLDGSYSNGLPARLVLTRDTSPTGALAVKLAGSNTLHSTCTAMNLSGAKDKTIVLPFSSFKGAVTVPADAYTLDGGMLSYGTGDRPDWEVAFSKGPSTIIRAGETNEQALGLPVLRVRAVNEQERYNSRAKEVTSFKQGTRIYLEPRITGQAGEILTRFRQGPADRSNRSYRTPHITITGPGDKEYLSKAMEYG